MLMHGNHKIHGDGRYVAVTHKKLAELRQRLEPYRRLENELAKLIHLQWREWRLSVLKEKR
jgi:hypothetical protein